MSKELFNNAKYERTHVYLDDSYEERPPKHLIKTLIDKIESLIYKINPLFSLLDVGSASGEFPYYFKKRFPQSEVTCLEYDKKLCERGQSKLKNCTFVCGDANSMNMFHNKQFRIITLNGVISIFDDFVPSLSECLRVTQDGGTVFVVSQFNEYPIDMLVRWRYSGECGEYNRGYNKFSKKSINDFLQANERVNKWEYEKFHLPFDLEKQEDLIRTWTEFDKDGNRIFKNGLEMEIDIQFLTIHLK